MRVLSWALFAASLFLFTNLSFSDFLGFKWGVDYDTVRLNASTLLIPDKSNSNAEFSIYYGYGKIGDLAATVYYAFDLSNNLKMGVYQITNTSYDDYSFITNILYSKYGKPNIKDHNSVLYNTKDTQIYAVINASNFIYIKYISIKYLDNMKKIENARKKQAEEDAKKKL